MAAICESPVSSMTMDLSADVNVVINTLRKILLGMLQCNICSMGWSDYMRSLCGTTSVTNVCFSWVLLKENNGIKMLYINEQCKQTLLHLLKKVYMVNS